MPERSGISHVSLSVRDLDRSVAFYRDVFGFKEFERLGSEIYREMVMLHSSEEHYGAVLCCRDVDGIQLEMFYRENHP